MFFSIPHKDQIKFLILYLLPKIEKKIKQKFTAYTTLIGSTCEIKKVLNIIQLLCISDYIIYTFYLAI